MSGVTIAEFLRQTTQTFDAAGITSARLDALVLMERALKHNKAWLLAHGEEIIAAEPLAGLQNDARRRANREPIAYITGQQEFYGRQFVVTPSVLIPRPETELLVDLLKTLPVPDNATLLDVGTGSGVLAITAASERPHLRVEACDISPTALDIATQNAERLGTNIHFFTSDLLVGAEHRYDIIIANLPYVAADWQRSPETDFEPELALFATKDGLDLVIKLIAAAPDYLNTNGYLLLEADPRQFAAIKKVAQPMFNVIRCEGFVVVLKKVD
ncbi:MAG TPA: peptide chain release factor N(5)-glutamine methyltransferase [Magnetospirillaceae bacterium]|nr:peptide chain release factor N(5)-glutamine methyltransferase [Magnetospirillaceae bacterium]